MLVERGRRTSFLLARERSRGLLLCEGFRDRMSAPNAKAKISHPKIGGTSRLLAHQGRGCVSSATSLDTLDGIALRGRDPRVMGHHSSNHQWDMHKGNLFLSTLPWVKEDSISLRVLHKHLLFHRQAKEAKVWVEVGVRDKAHRPGLQGPKGVATSLHHRLSVPQWGRETVLGLFTYFFRH